VANYSGAGNPSVTTDNTAPRMFGLGHSGWTFRPQKSGVIIIILSFDIAGTGSNQAFWQLGFGSGAAPGNGSNWYAVGANGMGGGHGPGYQGTTCTLQGVISGLGIGTLYWFDLAVTSTSGTQTVQADNIAATVFEL
jgi:hypothetical protein